jgi:hypothetical protein
MDKIRCKESVHNPGTTVTFHRCTRYAVRDGYCRQHHPDAVEARLKKSHETYQRRLAHDPLHLALQSIERLKAENATLKRQLVECYKARLRGL